MSEGVVVRGGEEGSRKESSGRGVKAPLTHLSLCVLCCCWGSVQYESGAGLQSNTRKQITQEEMYWTTKGGETRPVVHAEKGIIRTHRNGT